MTSNCHVTNIHVRYALQHYNKVIHYMRHFTVVKSKKQHMSLGQSEIADLGSELK